MSYELWALISEAVSPCGTCWPSLLGDWQVLKSSTQQIFEELMKGFPLTSLTSSLTRPIIKSSVGLRLVREYMVSIPRADHGRRGQEHKLRSSLGVQSWLLTRKVWSTQARNQDYNFCDSYMRRKCSYSHRNGRRICYPFPLYFIRILGVYSFSCSNCQSSILRVIW